MAEAETIRQTITIHPFRREKGKLVPGETRPGSTEFGAVRTAEAMSARYDGVVAIATQVDTVTDEVIEVRELARFGDAPSFEQ